jgi:hypothetical protein
VSSSSSSMFCCSCVCTVRLQWQAAAVLQEIAPSAVHMMCAQCVSGGRQLWYCCWVQVGQQDRCWGRRSQSGTCWAGSNDAAVLVTRDTTQASVCLFLCGMFGMRL